MAWNQDYGAGANPGSTYEQQSWRDSYNGGQAAGDWTGNHNARLESERDNFQGATWSGSSSQPSALQLAQSFVGSGPAVGSVARGVGAAGTGPGNDGVIVSGGSPRKPAGGSLTLAGGSGPLTPNLKDTAMGGWAGFEVFPNPWFSDVENFGEPRYGEPGEWLGGVINIAADIPYNAALRAGLNTDRLFADLANAPARVWAGAKYDGDKISRTPDGNHWSPFWEVNASARRGADGIYKTGGGF